MPHNDVVFTFSANETWHDAALREFCRPPDQIAQRLVADPTLGRVVIVNPWRSHIARLKNPPADAYFTSGPARQLVQPRRWRRTEETGLPQLIVDYRTYGLKIKKAWAGDSAPSALITFNPFVAAFSGLEEWGCRLTYYARDDWASYPPHRAWWPAYEGAFEALRQRRTAVVAVSLALLTRLRPSGPALCLPNAVDEAVWSRLPEASHPPTRRRPLVMYTGTIDDRLDELALASVARHAPDASIVLVGPQRGAMASRLKSVIPRLEIVPPVGQTELAALVATADVCIVPHVDSLLTQTMSPLKLYEYLAAGRPVVASDLAPMRGIDKRVVLTADVEDFGRAVATAARTSPISESARASFVRANSWRRRYEELMAFALPRAPDSR